jgi:hypothetical protein
VVISEIFSESRLMYIRIYLIVFFVNPQIKLTGLIRNLGIAGKNGFGTSGLAENPPKVIVLKPIPLVVLDDREASFARGSIEKNYTRVLILIQIQ